MKPFLITTYLLAALGYPLTAQETSEQTETEQTVSETGLKARISRPYRYFVPEEDDTIKIIFETPMIEADKLDTAPTDGYYSFYYLDDETTELETTAEWESVNILKITLAETPKPWQRVCLALQDSVTDAAGNPYEPVYETFCTSHAPEILSASDDCQIVFFGAYSQTDDELLEERINTLEFRTNSSTMPANARPATAGDAVRHWDAYRSAFYRSIDNNTRKDMAELDPSTPLPHTWICDIPHYPAAHDKLELYLPDVRPIGSDYGDLHIETIHSIEPSIYCYNEVINKGEYRIHINFGAPALANDLPALVQSLTWKLVEADVDSDSKAVEAVWKDGALRANIDGTEVVISIDETETLNNTHNYRKIDGTLCKGASGLVMRAKVGNGEDTAYRLSCSGHYLTVNDSQRRTPDHSSTMMSMSRPHITSDVFAGQMMSSGSTTINYEYDHIKNGKVTLYKLDSSGSNVARVLTAYNAWYNRNKYIGFGSADDQKARRSHTKQINRMNIVPTELLPGLQQTVTCPIEGTAGNGSINLAKQFGTTNATGAYFICITGESLRTEDDNAPVVNQGFVQVTDLGLLWKTDGKRIYAWGYHLSDGRDIAEGTLHMLDANGNQLAETPLRAGIASSDFPENTKFLHISTADDSALIVVDPESNEYDAYANYDSYCVSDMGIPANELPQGLIYLFSDRSIYRPGETAHIKGLVRWVLNNEVLTASPKSIKAKVYNNGEVISTHDVTPQQDGNFNFDYTPTKVGDHYISFELTYEGDDNNTSADKSVLKKYGVNLDSWRAESYILEPSRKAEINLTVEEYRRNEFELKSKLSTNWEARTAQMTTQATNFTTTPVAHAQVRWRTTVYRNNFYPKKWKDYRFGDYSDGYSDHYFSAYYLDNMNAGAKVIENSGSTGELDADGCGKYTFTLPDQEAVSMGYINVIASAYVTNGNEQSLSSTKTAAIHPCQAYAGIKMPDSLLQSGKAAQLQYVAITPDEKVWDGEPLTGKIKIVRESFLSYRYGSSTISSVHNVPEEEVVLEQDISYSNSPGVIEFTPQHAGKYTFVLECTDPNGQIFASAITRYVWGDNVSPWYYGHNTTLNLVQDKQLYRIGDTAHILVQTPVDAEVLVTVERGTVLRHYKRTITVSNPVIEVPIEAGDAPVIYVGVSMVQSAKNRRKSGAPLIKMGACQLNVETPEKMLSVELITPEKHLLPQDECHVSGVVRDAEGKPVAHADVTLYAEDEGTLQVRGYSLPAPQYFFYSERGRRQGVNTLSSLGQLITDNMNRRYVGNKGIFIGGGGEDGMFSVTTDEEAEYLRQNFNPCALWLCNVKTDENGCFSTTYTNPDTLTRYRLMAVAATTDKFGAGKASYHVTKPIMLEPVAPLGSTEGDLLHLPVTVSMLPEHLDEAAGGAPVEWKVSLSGTNVTLPEPEKTVTLSGNKPVTITFPVKTEKTGQSELVWSVQAASATDNSRLSRCRDAVKLSFDVIPPTPFFKEKITRTLHPGETVTVQDWIQTDYRADSPIELTVSSSPLAGSAYPLKYLMTYPYGCSEQLSSTVIPWIIRNKLENALGIKFPEESSQTAVLEQTFKRLNNRKLDAAKYSYWDDEETACCYSPYVVLVQQLAIENGWHNLPGCQYYYMERQYEQLAQELIPEDSGIKSRVSELATGMEKVYTEAPNMISAFILAKAGKLSSVQFNAMHTRLRQMNKYATPAQYWMLALCAYVCHLENADAIRDEAAAFEKDSPSDYYSWKAPLPETKIIKVLCAIYRDASSDETTGMVTELLSLCSRYNTWTNGWLAYTLGEYLRLANIDNKKATVNGQLVSARNPLHLKLTAGAQDSLTCADQTVYINGHAEGHTNAAQDIRAIDAGLRVTRSYEKLLPDGTAIPTATFEKGDIVRVTLTVEAAPDIDADKLRYLAIEDRLPATFEAINPKLSSQALPPQYRQNEEYRSWWYTSFFENTEYHGNSVRFFAYYLGNNQAKAQYVARVVRSGSVSAPATKAELMYSPEIHGLSIPAQIEVK